MQEAGRVGIRVLPDTKQFRSDLKTALDRVERAITVSIPIELQVTKATIAAARTQIREALASESVKIKIDGDTAPLRRSTQGIVPPGVDVPVSAALDETWRTRMAAELKAATKGLEAVIPATAAGENLRGDLARQVERISATLKAEIPANPVAAADFRARVAALVADINDKKATIKADVDDAAAKRKLNGLDGKATVNADADTGKASVKMAAVSRTRTAEIVASVRSSSIAAVEATLMRLSGARVAGDLFGNLGASLSNLDKAAPKIAAITAAVLTMSAGALAGVSNLAGIGASLAAILPITLALPGAFAGAIVGIGVLALALKDTSKVLADLGPQFAAVQKSVSASFWAEAATPIRALANETLPQLKTSLSGISSEMGKTVAALAGDMGSQQMDVLVGILDMVKAGVVTARPGVVSLYEAFLGLTQVGATYLPAMGSAFTAVANQFNAFVGDATTSGQVFVWVDAAMANILALGSVIGSLGGILGGVATAAQAAGGTNLQAFAGGLKSVADAVNGPIGQGILTQLFTSAHAAMAALAPGVTDIMGALGGLVPMLSTQMPAAAGAVSLALSGIGAALSSPLIAQGIGQLVGGLTTGLLAIVPVMPLVGAALGSIAGVVGTMVAAFAPLIAALVTALVPALISLAPVIQTVVTALAGMLLPVITALTPLVTSIVAVVIALLPPIMELVSTVAASLMPIITSLVEIVQMLLPVFLEVASVLLPALTAAFATVGPAVAGLVAALVPFTAALVDSLMPQIQAAAPIVQTAFGIIGDVIATVLGVVTGIIDVFTALLKGDWAGAWSAAQGVVETVTGALTSVIEGEMSAMGSAVQSGLDTAVGFLSSLPGRMADALSGLAQIGLNAGSALMNSLASAITGAASKAVSSAQNALQSIANLFPHSPAKTGPFSGSGYTDHSGAALMSDFAGGMLSQRSGVIGAASAVLAEVSSRIDGLSAATAMSGAAIATATVPTGPRVNAPAQPAALSQPAGPQRFVREGFSVVRDEVIGHLVDAVQGV